MKIPHVFFDCLKLFPNNFLPKIIIRHVEIGLNDNNERTIKSELEDDSKKVFNR